MEFTTEELALVAKHREQQTMAAEAAETARRQQSIHKTVSDLLDQAKQLLIDAKQVAKDNGLQYQIEGMVTEMINEVSDGQYWYGSDQSLC